MKWGEEIIAKGLSKGKQSYQPGQGDVSRKILLLCKAWKYKWGCYGFNCASPPLPPNSYIKLLIPVPHSVALFENRVLADVAKLR